MIGTSPTDSPTLASLKAETPLQRAERRWHEALRRGADGAVIVDAASEYIFRLEVSLHGAVAS